MRKLTLALILCLLPSSAWAQVTPRIYPPLLPMTCANGEGIIWNSTTIRFDCGSVGGSGSVATDTIFDAAGDLVQGTGANTSARLAIGTANQLLRVNAGATAVEYASTLSGLTFVAPALGTPASGNAANLLALPPGGVTFAASDRILCRDTASGGVGEECTASAVLAMIGATQGNVLYHNGTSWVVLAPGTNGHYLQTQGAGANPQWAAAAGSGDALVANPLSQFATTTSLQFIGVISDETGTGAAVFANTPTLVTPVLGAATGTSIAFGSDPADAGVLRLENAAVIGWEASPAGTDLTLTVNSSEQFVFSAAILSPTFVTPTLGVATGTSVAVDDEVYDRTGWNGDLTVPTKNAVSDFLDAILVITAPATGTDLGAAATAFRDLYLYGAGTYSTTSLKFTGTPTGNRTITFPDASITVARSDAAQTFTGVQTFTSPSVTTGLDTGSTTFALLNTTATTVNAFGAATTVNTGAAATQIWNFGGSTTASEFRFLEPSGSGTNYTAFKAVAQGANITYSLPATVGGAGTFLKDVAGDGVLSWATPGGSGTVTATGGSLTANAVVLGAGTTDTKVSTGITTNGTAQLVLGVNATTIGTVKLFGNTSGDVTISPTAAAGTATAWTIPATSDTFVGKATTDTLTNKTLTSPTFTTPALGTPASGTLSLPFHMIYLTGVCQNATASVGLSTPSTLGAAGACETVAAASGDVAYGSAVFVTGGANTEVHGHFPIPSDWTGAIDVQVKWRAASTTANDVVFQIKFGCTATGEATTAVSLNNTAFTAVTNLTTTLQWNVATKTSITTTGCAANEQAMWILDRDTDTTGDTLDADVQVMSIDFTYRRAVVIGG